LEDRPNDAFRTIFKVEFLEDSELVGLLVENATAIKLLMQTSTPSDVSNFKQGIRDRSEGSKSIKELEKKLDIRLVKK
jgi:hypothetical protein